MKADWDKTFFLSSKRALSVIKSLFSSPKRDLVWQDTFFAKTERNISHYFVKTERKTVYISGKTERMYQNEKALTICYSLDADLADFID